MRRRQFIMLLGGAIAALPVAARAQKPDRVRRLGVLMLGAETDPDQQGRVMAFREGLAKLGWAEGRSIQTDYRFAGADPERIRSYAAALVGQAPDVIVANGTPVLEALQALTRSAPIVFVGVSDPVSAGFEPSLARPGGNITGFSNFEYAIGGKWLELLKEAAPGINRIGVLLWRGDPSWSRYLAPIETAASSLGMPLTTIFLGDTVEIERAIEAFAHEPLGGLIATNNSKAMAERDRIIGLAARRRLPAVYPARVYASSGGLMSYGIDPADPFRQAASYVDRILRGEKPGDLPVQQPTKYELVVNLKTAKALGLAVPPTLIARVDEAIE
jgi:putative tryptophan/tyrosine transport system substrate-binding protein